MNKLSKSARRFLVALALPVGLTCVSPTTASAVPPGFPDLNHFIEAPAADHFTRPGKMWNGYAFFRTPSGISCAIGDGNWCYGDLPGLAPDQKSMCTAITRGNPSEPFRFKTSDKPCVPASDNVLNPGEKLTFEAYGTTCVVGEGNLTACIDNWHNHGFVLQPSGSWAF